MDYPIVNGRSTFYPAPGEDFGANFKGSTATFFLPGDFLTLPSAALAIPNLPISVLSASPVVVPDSFFGMSVMNRSNDSLTGVTASTVRSHDLANGKGRWQKIEISPGVWDWTDVDSWVNTHYAAGRELIFTLFATPPSYSARPTEVGAYRESNPGIQAEPKVEHMDKWDAFCTAVVTRYLGKIKYFEVWNEPNFNNNGTTTTGAFFFFSGTWAKLAEMTRRASQAIKAVDPTAKIISPPVQGWLASGTNLSGDYFVGMMDAPTGDGTTKMRDWIDIVGVHLYLPSVNRVQDLAGVIDRVNAAKTTAGVSAKETWDTESAPIGGDANTLTDTQLKALVARMLIIMAAKGINRTLYYQYDHAEMGFNTRSTITEYREEIIALLKSGTIQAVSGFTDGRIACYTNSLTII